MQFKSTVLLLLTLLVAPTAYAGGGLWGDIDEPMQDAKEVIRKQIEDEKKAQKELEQRMLADEKAAKEAAAKEAQTAEQKTVCEPLSAKMKLDSGDLNSSDVLSKIRTAVQSMPDQYQALLSTEEGMQELYSAYRTKYLQVYCTKE